MKIARRRGVRARVCESCERHELVRSDNPATRCRDCASKANGRAGAAKLRGIARASRVGQRRPTLLATCVQCGKAFPTTNSATSRAKRRYCSVACKMLFCGVQRTCKGCGREFRALKSRIAGIARNNSSSNFCSRQCYEDWLCKPDRVTGRGSQWHTIRRRVLARAPFCARCGTTRRLDVHHIVPFRMTHDNREANLIPLCKRCHKLVESLLNDVVLTDLEPPMILLAFGSLLRDLQLATLMKMRSLQSLNG